MGSTDVCSYDFTHHDLIVHVKTGALEGIGYCLGDCSFSLRQSLLYFFLRHGSFLTEYDNPCLLCGMYATVKEIPDVYIIMDMNDHGLYASHQFFLIGQIRTVYQTKLSTSLLVSWQD